jgi:hypothetical protein
MMQKAGFNYLRRMIDLASIGAACYSFKEDSKCYIKELMNGLIIAP